MISAHSCPIIGQVGTTASGPRLSVTYTIAPRRAACCGPQQGGPQQGGPHTSLLGAGTGRGGLGLGRAVPSDLLGQYPVLERAHLRVLPPPAEQPRRLDAPAANQSTFNHSYTVTDHSY